MILFASGRCDIAAYYSDWFFQRIKAGFVDVRNPYDPHQISRIPLTEANVDAILFCTKNPLPMLPRLKEIAFPFWFHVTLTPYHQDIEPNVIDKQKICDGIRSLAAQIGRERIVIRYDPILFTARYDIAYHVRAFTKLVETLHDCCERIIISFVDLYRNTKANAQKIGLLPLREADMIAIAKHFGPIAAKYQLPLQTCAEAIDLSPYGITAGSCISQSIMEQLLHRPYAVPRGKPVRNCACLPSVDIGDYNACAHLCRYCYANYDEAQVKQRMGTHDVESSVLLGKITAADHITVRREKHVRQLPLFS